MIDILITDDEQISVDAIKFVIQRNFVHDVNIYTAYNGESALQILSKTDIDIIFMDMNMPGLNGIETIQKINQVSSKYIIIAISGYENSYYEEQLKKLQVYKFLHKPIKKDVLVQTVNEVLKRFIRIG